MKTAFSGGPGLCLLCQRIGRSVATQGLVQRDLGVELVEPVGGHGQFGAAAFFLRVEPHLQRGGTQAVTHLVQPLGLGGGLQLRSE